MDWAKIIAGFKEAERQYGATHDNLDDFYEGIASNILFHNPEVYQHIADTAQDLTKLLEYKRMKRSSRELMKFMIVSSMASMYEIMDSGYGRLLSTKVSCENGFTQPPSSHLLGDIYSQDEIYSGSDLYCSQ